MTDGETTGYEQTKGRQAGGVPAQAQPTGAAPQPSPTGGQQNGNLSARERALQAFLSIREALNGPATDDKDRDKTTWGIPGL